MATALAALGFQPDIAQSQENRATNQQAVAGPRPIPDDLRDWRLSIANVSFRESGPSVDVAGNGSLAIRRRKSGSGSVHVQLADNDLHTLFSTAAAVINGTYLASPGREYTLHDAPVFEVQLTRGFRTIRVELEDPQPDRMGIDGQLNECIAIVRTAMREKGLEYGFPRAMTLNDSYRDKVLSDRHERIPQKLDQWSWVDVQRHSEARRVHLRMHSADPRNTGLLIESGNERSVRPTVTPEERDAFYECAKIILNQFEILKQDPRPVRYGERLSIGIKAHDRTITVEFDDYLGLPAEWRDGVEKVIKLSGIDFSGQDGGSASTAAGQGAKGQMEAVPGDLQKWKIRFDGFAGTPGDRSWFYVSVAHDGSVKVTKRRVGRGSWIALNGNLDKEETDEFFRTAARIINEYRREKSDGRTADGWQLTLGISSAAYEEKAVVLRDQNDPSKKGAPSGFDVLAKIINRHLKDEHFP